MRVFEKMDFTLQKSKIDALNYKNLRIVKFSNKFIKTIYSEINSLFQSCSAHIVLIINKINTLVNLFIKVYLSMDVLTIVIHQLNCKG